MSKTKNNVNELLAAIKRQTAEPAPQPAPKEEPVPHTTQAVEKPKKKDEKPAAPMAAKKPKSKTGKAVQFWMHAEDTQLVRELSAWLAGQGVRTSDSLVIRAALRYSKTGNVFLEAYRQAATMDGRLKHD
jgi:outer membrane biosynthesis protein TonB